MKPMKITLPLIGLTLFFFINLNAQNFELGLKTGFGIANTHITDLPDAESHSDIFSPISSYSINGVMIYKGKGIWGFSIEPGIVQKGNFSHKGNNMENKSTLQYLQIPVLMDLNVQDKLFFSIGPEMNYLLDAKNKSDYGTVKITDLTRDFELAGVVGGTYNILDYLDIGIRYSHGITQTSDKVFWVLDELNENPMKMKNYNQYLQLFIKLKLIKL